MDLENSSFRTGFVAVVGRPNVGKSTLINALLKQKVAAVSPKPQTTRRTQLGILTMPEAQAIMMDTPGLHNPVHKLGECMNQAALDTLANADVILWLVDLTSAPGEEDQLVAERLREVSELGPVVLAANKVDITFPTVIDERTAAYAALFPVAQVVQISAASRKGLEALLAAVTERLPEGLPLYDEDQVTDLYERDIAAELLREAALLNLRDEVPHALAVRIDEFKERSDEQAFIGATLLVERDSQKGIVIGKGGEMLKRIGSAARREIEAMSGRKVFLELRVKVVKNWRDNPSTLRVLGYTLPKDQKKPA